MNREVHWHITEDFARVNQFDPVYEIRYAWINFEVSLAYPERTCINKLPAGTKVWKNDTSVLRECYKRNHPKKEVWL